MNSRNSRPRVPWSHGDKFLMLLLGLVLPLALGLVFWFRALDRNPDVPIPTPTMPATNARDYYIAASNAVIDDKKIEDARVPQSLAGRSPNSPPPPSLADKEKLVAENAGAIQTLHTGFHYPYQELPARSFSTPFPHYQKIRALARFLSLQAQVDMEKGDAGGAMGASLDAVQMGETMPHGGPLIGMLVGVACQAIGRQQAWKAVGHLNSAQARAAARRLEIIRTSHESFADTMQEEEWTGQAGLLELMRRPDWSAEVASATTPDPSGEQSGNSPGRWLFATRIRMIGKRRILADYTRALDRIIAEGRRPFAARSPAPAIEVTGDPVSDMITPVFGNTRLNEVKADTENALLLVTLALRAYKLDHGAYPPTLAALAPHYLQAVPGRPLRPVRAAPLQAHRPELPALQRRAGRQGRRGQSDLRPHEARPHDCRRERPAPLCAARQPGRHRGGGEHQLDAACKSGSALKRHGAKPPCFGKATPRLRGHKDHAPNGSFFAREGGGLHF